ncbi:hypothetical protein HDU97_005388 [Phlyctochytrium planicorne]|nr:hypothetical protein HDU97_005388 [Phlyctochytrium planicorne]
MTDAAAGAEPKETQPAKRIRASVKKGKEEAAAAGGKDEIEAVEETRGKGTRSGKKRRLVVRSDYEVLTDEREDGVEKHKDMKKKTKGMKNAKEIEDVVGSKEAEKVRDVEEQPAKKPRGRPRKNSATAAKADETVKDPMVHAAPQLQDAEMAWSEQVHAVAPKLRQKRKASQKPVPVIDVDEEMVSADEQYQERPKRKRKVTKKALELNEDEEEEQEQAVSKKKARKPKGKGIETELVPAGATLSTIPNEILDEILKYFKHPVELCRLTLVSKFLNNSVSNSLIWKNFAPTIVGAPNPRSKLTKTWKLVLGREWKCFCDICHRKLAKKTDLFQCRIELGGGGMVVGKACHGCFLSRWNAFKRKNYVSEAPGAAAEAESKRMTKGRAKDEYRLKDFHMGLMHYDPVKNPHHREAAPMCLYQIRDLRRMYDFVHGGPATLRIAEQKKSERLEKAVPRKSAKQKREEALEAALAARGLQLRDDSRLCEAYIKKGEGDLYSIVTVMAEMDWYFRCTDYAELRMSLALDEWCLQRVEQGNYLSPRHDPESKRRPPPSLWISIERIMDGLIKRRQGASAGTGSTTKFGSWAGVGPGHVLGAEPGPSSALDKASGGSDSAGGGSGAQVGNRLFLEPILVADPPALPPVAKATFHHAPGTTINLTDVPEQTSADIPHPSVDTSSLMQDFKGIQDFATAYGNANQGGREPFYPTFQLGQMPQAPMQNVLVPGVPLQAATNLQGIPGGLYAFAHGFSLMPNM